MATRPIFVPDNKSAGMVREISFEIPWAGGFSVAQKKKNILALHAAAAACGYSPLLEVSTKSSELAGQHLSAFHLKVRSVLGDMPLECAFQGSKIFERGGPYIDLFEVEPRQAKRDPRLQQSGRLIAFEFEGELFPLQPSTVFYDWLYLTAVFPHRAWLIERLKGRVNYAGFTDIEFNPSKSVNCQARSCALFVALMQAGELEDVLATPGTFIRAMTERGAVRVGLSGEARLVL